MMKKIYTKTGDKGKTSLVGGERIEKNSIKVESYGTIDELNSILGLVRAFNNSKKEIDKNICKFCEFIEKELKKIQNKLFDVASSLATPEKDYSESLSYSIKEEDIQYLENLMDTMAEELIPLNKFILPGGGIISGYLHNARTVCRRAERRILTLSETEKLSPNLIKFVNRLSDTLFVMARWVAYKMNEPEFYRE